MTEQQFQKFLDMQKAQFVVLHGIYNVLQAIAVANNWRAGTVNFNDAQKIIDSAAQMK